jgi:hypothetical protein
MALIATSVLIGIADRAAYQYKLLEDAFTSLNATGGGKYFDRVTVTDDPDIEIPLEATYRIVDNNMLVLWTVKQSVLGNVVTAMNAHFNIESGGSPLQVGGWDGYCQDNDIRMSDYFNKLYYAAQFDWMRAIDVFSESDDVFATLDVAAGPTLNFTDGVNYGNGAAINPATGGLFAATQLKIVVVTMGAIDLDLRLSVKDVDNNPTTIDVTVPGGSAPGTEVNIGLVTDRFLDVFNAVFVPAGNTGTLGDEVTVQNIKERIIAL